MHEDIMVESVALVDRIEFQCDAIGSEPIVVGFRRNGAMSLFIGDEEVYHFNSTGQWRRGFWCGCLLKADQGQLAELTRDRGRTETILRRVDLSDGQQQEHTDRLGQRAIRLCDALNRNQIRVTRQINETGDDLRSRMRAAFDRLSRGIQIAQSPRVC